MIATAQEQSGANTISSRAWPIVFMLFVVACLNYADRTAISSVFPLLKAELGLTDVQLAALGSFFLWTYAAASPFAGLLADRFSRSRIILISMVAWSIVTILTGLSRNATDLLLSRALLGIAESAYLPAAIALIADHHPPASRGSAMGLHLCGLNLGLVAGGGLAGYLGEQYGWRFSFLVLGAVGLVLVLIASRVLQDGPKQTRAISEVKRKMRLSDLIPLLRTPSYLVIITEAMTIAVGVWMFFNWMPLYFRETYGMGLATAGLSGTMTLQISASAGILLGGFLSDRVAKRGEEKRMLFMGICYLLAAPCLLVFLGKQSLAVVTTAVVVFSFGRALASSNEDAILCDVLPQANRATALGFLNTMNCLAGGVGIMIAGFLKHDVGLSGMFAFVSVLVVFAGVVSLIGYFVFLPRDLTRRKALEEA